MLERHPQVSCEVRHVPEHVAQFLGQRRLLLLRKLRAGHVALVAHELPELLRHLARLPGELQGGIDDAGVLWVEGGAAGAGLVLVERHGTMLTNRAGRGTGWSPGRAPDLRPCMCTGRLSSGTVP